MLFYFQHHFDGFLNGDLIILVHGPLPFPDRCRPCTAKQVPRGVDEVKLCTHWYYKLKGALYGLGQRAAFPASLI